MSNTMYMSIDMNLHTERIGPEVQRYLKPVLSYHAMPRTTICVLWPLYDHNDDAMVFMYNGRRLIAHLNRSSLRDRCAEQAQGLALLYCAPM